MANDSDRGGLIKNFFANTLQVLGNQFLGVFIFLLISRSFDKPSFGELSWSLAVLTLITTLLSLRLEQIVVRNVAAGDNPSGMLTLFAAHNFFTVLGGATWPTLSKSRHPLYRIRTVIGN